MQKYQIQAAVTWNIVWLYLPHCIGIQPGIYCNC